MGREGKKTLLGTSIAEIYIKIIDAYIAQEEKKYVLRPKISRAEVVQDAVLNLISNKGVLDIILQELQVPAEEVSDIKVRLKAEYGISPK